MGEVRYNSLKLRFPERAERLFEEAEEAAKERYETLVHRQKSMEDMILSIKNVRAINPHIFY